MNKETSDKILELLIENKGCEWSPGDIEFELNFPQAQIVQAVDGLIKSGEPILRGISGYQYVSKYIDYSKLEVKPVNWLWYPYIARGKLTLVRGDPGVGKTFFCTYLISCVSSGSPFYMSQTDNLTAPQFAMYQTAEDGCDDTILLRLVSMQPPPDLHHIRTYDERIRPLQLSDTRLLEEIMSDTRPAIMIFDPLQAYIGAGIDLNKANEVRPVLRGVQDLAEKYECAVVIIEHNGKDTKKSAIGRGLGSIDITGAARSVLGLYKNPLNEKQRALYHIKSNLADNGDAILFHIDDQAGGIVFDGTTKQPLKEFTEPPIIRAAPKSSNAKDFLLQHIQEHGYIDVRQARSFAEQIGISMETMGRAKRDMGLISITVSFGNNSNPLNHTYWTTSNVDKGAFIEARKAEILADQTEGGGITSE